MKIPKSKTFRIIILVIIFYLINILNNCSGKSEEDLILRSLTAIGEYAENRDIDSLMVYISDSYSDAEQRTAATIEELIRKNVNRYKQVNIRLLNSKVNEIRLPEADIELDICFTRSKAVKTINKFISMLGIYYRFKLKMVKEDKVWVIKSAHWHPIPKSQLL